MTDQKNDFVDISSSADVKRIYAQDQRRVPAVKKNQGLGLRVTALILSILMLLGGAGLLGWNYLNERSHQYKALEPADSKAQAKTDTKSSSGNSSANQTLLTSKNVLNVLLFGQDAHATEKDHGRSDTTILLSIDNVHKKLKMTSFQRDTLVNIPGYGDNKINAAFTLGGERLAIDTIETNFGIKVDKYATVDFDAFRQIIGQLGGIDIELTTEEIKYINAQIDVNGQTDRTQFLKFDESKEKQMVHLDGYQALWYARNRGEESLGGNPEYSFSGDDWDRTSRQRNLIETIVKSLRNEASLSDLVGIVNKVGPYITTNLKKNDINFLVTNMMTYINYDIQQMSMRELDWGYSHTADGQSVIEIRDWNSVRAAIAKFIYEEAVSVN